MAVSNETMYLRWDNAFRLANRLLYFVPSDLLQAEYQAVDGQGSREHLWPQHPRLRSTAPERGTALDCKYPPETSGDQIVSRSSEKDQMISMKCRKSLTRSLRKGAREALLLPTKKHTERPKPRTAVGRSSIVNTHIAAVVITTHARAMNIKTRRIDTKSVDTEVIGSQKLLDALYLPLLSVTVQVIQETLFNNTPKGRAAVAIKATQQMPIRVVNEFLRLNFRITYRPRKPAGTSALETIVKLKNRSPPSFVGRYVMPNRATLFTALHWMNRYSFRLQYMKVFDIKNVSEFIEIYE